MNRISRIIRMPGILGDGVVTESSPAFSSINHMYVTTGNFTAKVTVSDGKNTDTKNVAINAGYLPLVANVFVCQLPAPPLTVNFPPPPPVVWPPKYRQN